MTKVVALMSMSLDGYVADANDGVSEVFDWCFSGDVEVPDSERQRLGRRPERGGAGAQAGQGQRRQVPLLDLSLEGGGVSNRPHPPMTFGMDNARIVGSATGRPLILSNALGATAEMWKP